MGKNINTDDFPATLTVSGAENDMYKYKAIIIIIASVNCFTSIFFLFLFTNSIHQEAGKIPISVFTLLYIIILVFHCFN